MASTFVKSTMLLGLGFAAGLAAANLPAAFASAGVPTRDLSHRKFLVSIDEVKQNFVFGETFSGSYHKTVRLSDGATRTIDLTPTVHQGMQLVELDDTGFVTYMGLNGATTNGHLMIQVRDLAANDEMMRRAGWRGPPLGGNGGP